MSIINIRVDEINSLVYGVELGELNKKNLQTLVTNSSFIIFDYLKKYKKKNI